QYVGLDRFGRVVDQRWSMSSSSTADRFQYGYDRDDNVLFKKNTLSPGNSELYHANGSSNGYDQLNRLTNFTRGALNSSNDTISRPATTADHSASWTLDALGNWTGSSTDGASTSRTNNAQNQVTQLGAATLGYDTNGNTTTDDQGHTLIYDAWNRLVQDKS